LILDIGSSDKQETRLKSLGSAEALREALSRAVADPDSMRDYLRYLQQMGIKHPFPYNELMDWDRTAEMIEQGLECLTPTELAVLALNPLQLLDLRDRLAEEEELSDAWWPIFRQYNPLAATIAEAFDEYADELQELLQESPSAGVQRELAGAYFGEQPPEQTSEPQPPGRSVWTVKRPVAAVVVAWREMIAPEFQRNHEHDELIVEFDRIAQGESCEFCVRLGRPLTLTSKVTCQSELRDDADQCLAEGRHDAGSLVFSVDAERLSLATCVWIQYRHPERCDLEIRIPIRD